jgi:hypothetical protein
MTARVLAKTGVEVSSRNLQKLSGPVANVLRVVRIHKKHYQYDCFI